MVKINAFRNRTELGFWMTVLQIGSFFAKLFEFKSDKFDSTQSLSDKMRPAKTNFMAAKLLAVLVSAESDSLL